MLGARASTPAKTSPRTMTVLLVDRLSHYLCRRFWLRLHVLAQGFSKRLQPKAFSPETSPLQIDRHALPLRITVEHSFERILAADATLFVPTVGLTRKLSKSLVDLYPAGLDLVCRLLLEKKKDADITYGASR